MFARNIIHVSEKISTKSIEKSMFSVKNKVKFFTDKNAFVIISLGIFVYNSGVYL